MPRARCRRKSTSWNCADNQIVFLISQLQYDYCTCSYLHHRRWTEVTFSLLSDKDISKSWGWIRTKLGGHDCVTRNNRLDIGEDLDPITGLEFLIDSSPLRDGAQNNISQDISKSYGWILMKLGGSVGCVATTDTHKFHASKGWFLRKYLEN